MLSSGRPASTGPVGRSRLGGADDDSSGRSVSVSRRGHDRDDRDEVEQRSASEHQRRQRAFPPGATPSGSEATAAAAITAPRRAASEVSASRVAESPARAGRHASATTAGSRARATRSARARGRRAQTRGPPGRRPRPATAGAQRARAGGRDGAGSPGPAEARSSAAKSSGGPSAAIGAVSPADSSSEASTSASRSARSSGAEVAERRAHGGEVRVDLRRGTGGRRHAVTSTSIESRAVSALREPGPALPLLVELARPCALMP